MTAIDAARAVTRSERALLSAIKFEIRALLLAELPDDPGPEACKKLDAAEGPAWPARFANRCRGPSE